MSSMSNQADNKFTLVISNFSSYKRGITVSDEFIISGCKWRLFAYHKGHIKPDCFDLCLQVSDCQSLPPELRRDVRFNMTIVNQNPGKSIKLKELPMLFDQSSPHWVSEGLLPLSKLRARDSGFLVNDEVKIVVEINVGEVIGKLDASQLSATPPPKKIKLESMVSTSVMESIDVNGFQVLPAQVEAVRRIFERHPNIAVEFRAKSQYLRTTCMNILLNLIQTLCQSLQDLSIDDLAEAQNALTHLKHSCFKVEWLEKKLDQVKEKKKKEQIGETLTRELERDLKDYKKKCSDIEAILKKKKEELEKCKQECIDIEYLLEKEKANVLAIRAPPLTFDDVI